MAPETHKKTAIFGDTSEKNQIVFLNYKTINEATAVVQRGQDAMVARVPNRQKIHAVPDQASKKIPRQVRIDIGLHFA